MKFTFQNWFIHSFDSKNNLAMFNGWDADIVTFTKGSNFMEWKVAL